MQIFHISLIWLFLSVVPSVSERIIGYIKDICVHKSW